LPDDFFYPIGNYLTVDVVIDDQNRRDAARADATCAAQAVATVGGGIAGLDFQLFFNASQEVIGAAHIAGSAGADGNGVVTPG